MQKIVKQYIDENGNPYSPWHNINLSVSDNIYNFVCEIPKLTKEKIEMDKSIEFNSLVHEIKDNNYRYYNNYIYWNYGFLPQTWEAPHHTLNTILDNIDKKNKVYNKYGDNDPLDFIDISESVLECGGIYQVKILGCIALIDEDELDWKVIGINNKDENFKKYKNINDVPDYIKLGIREWFRWYKYPDNLKLNEYGFNEEFLDKDFAKKIIEITHNDWINRYDINFKNN